MKIENYGAQHYLCQSYIHLCFMVQYCPSWRGPLYSCIQLVSSSFFLQYVSPSCNIALPFTLFPLEVKHYVCLQCLWVASIHQDISWTCTLAKGYICNYNYSSDSTQPQLHPEDPMNMMTSFILMKGIVLVKLRLVWWGLLQLLSEIIIIAYSSECWGIFLTGKVD